MRKPPNFVWFSIHSTIHLEGGGDREQEREGGEGGEGERGGRGGER